MILLQTISLVMIMHISVSSGRSEGGVIGATGPHKGPWRPIPGPRPPMPPMPSIRYCQKKLDIAFVIDASRSINKADFDRQKQFVIDIIDNLDIGVDKTRVAVIAFHAHVYKQFLFNTFSTKEEIKDAVSRIPSDLLKQGKATRTYKALEYIHRKIFRPGNGERKDVEDVVVFLTDGMTNSGSYDKLWGNLGPMQTQIEAAMVKSRPAHLFAIGVGSGVNTMELNGMSSDPDSIYTIQVPSYKELETREIKKMLLDRTCGRQKTTPVSSGRSEGGVIGATGPHKGPWRPIPGPRPPMPPMPSIRYCQKKLDIAFVIDASRSINKADFDRQKQFVIDIIDNLDIGVDKTRVAVIAFHAHVYKQFLFNTFSTKEEIKDAVSRIPSDLLKQGKATRTYKALEYIHRKIFRPGNGERKDVEDVVVFLTDGMTNSGSYDKLWGNLGPMQTQIEAAMVKSRPAHLFAIGVGSGVNTMELNGMSSDPDSIYTIQVPSYKELDTREMKKMLLDRTCGRQKTTPDCTNSVADVFFLIDDSASLDHAINFQKEIDFAISVVELLDVGPGKSRVGAIKYSREAEVMLNLNEAETKKEVARKLKQMTWRKGGATNLHKALKLLRTQGLNPMYGSRSDVPKIAIVITDGGSTYRSETIKELKKLHQQNYILFAIGSGPNLDVNELNRIGNDADHVFVVDNLDNKAALTKIRKSLAVRVCDQGISASDLSRKPDKPKYYY